MTEDAATQVWNRACDWMAEGVPAGAPEGDRRLVDALSFDGAVQANGVLQALETLDVAAGTEALRWFGLSDAADVIDQTRAAVDGMSDDELEEAEGRVDAAYYALDTEQRLGDALAERLASSPRAFMPI